jgi:hypothetical protein
MNIYVVFYQIGSYTDCDCIHTNVSLVTTDVNEVIEFTNNVFATERERPYKVEVWKDGKYMGAVYEWHFERPTEELKDILLKGGV